MRRLVPATCVVTFAYSALIGLIRFVNSNSDGAPGSLRSSVSLAAPFVVAGLVALLAHSAGKGHFVIAAGAGIIPAAVISFVAFPLWLAAVVFLVAGWRQSVPVPIGELVRSMFVTIGIFGSMIVLLARQDPIEWIHDGSDNYASDTITASESLLSATVLGLVLMVALVAVRSPLEVEASPDDPDG